MPIITNIKRPSKIYCDNNLVVLYSNNNKSSTRSKVIAIKNLIIKERIQKIKILIEHIWKYNMPVGPLTNGWHIRFHEHVAHIVLFQSLSWFSESLYVLCLDLNFIYLIFCQIKIMVYKFIMKLVYLCAIFKLHLRTLDWSR